MHEGNFVQDMESLDDEIAYDISSHPLAFASKFVPYLHSKAAASSILITFRHKYNDINLSIAFKLDEVSGTLAMLGIPKAHALMNT